MNTKTKFWALLVVVAAVLSWSAVETWRLWDTKQQLVEAQSLQRTVQAKYEATRAKHIQVAGAPDTTSTPPAKQ